MTATPPPGARTVPVPGGELTYEVTTGSTEPVLAIHGVSSHRRLWDWVHTGAPEITLVTPDLRGRADSVDVEGDSSLAQHVDDLIAVLDDVGLDAVHVCGMSMGGFVAVLLADRHPDRVKSLVLVDGGFPMALPPGLTRDTIAAVFADQVGRLERSWDSVDDYLDDFVATAAPLLRRDDPILRHYVEHDLRDGRVRLSGSALVSDASDALFGAVPWEALTLPVRFLHAEWSVGKGSSPAYPPEAVRRYAAVATTTDLIQGVDNAGTVMSHRGALATADMIREALT